MEVLFAHHGPVTTKIAAAAKKQPAVTFSHEKHALRLVAHATTHRKALGTIRRALAVF